MVVATPASIETRTDHVSITLPPATALLALRKRLMIPYSTIASAEAVDAPMPGLFVWRVGAHIPGRYAAGTFHVEGQKRFYVFSKGDRCVSLTLTGHDFDRVVVAPPKGESADDLVARIRSYLE